jgi:hypothetical protein
LCKYKRNIFIRYTNTSVIKTHWQIIIVIDWSLVDSRTCYIPFESFYLDICRGWGQRGGLKEMDYLKNVTYKTTKTFLSFIFIPFECWSYFTLLLINLFQTREVTIIDIFLLTNGMIHMCSFFLICLWIYLYYQYILKTKRYNTNNYVITTDGISWNLILQGSKSCGL